MIIQLSKLLSIKTIINNTYAPEICGNTCAHHGGWNGQWTNAYPAAQKKSVCGCNPCPLL
ncbi:MAG: hypothetical protein F6K59_28590 [Moorea sp. SIO3F7]|nr:MULTISPECIES: mannan-binding protein [unclassified Moorena]NEO16166.1 hypothetical protein [Moorena sp. SIO3E8]NEQ02695.1 hypothetical protein [Moorena sp. SIO3F7]